MEDDRGMPAELRPQPKSMPGCYRVGAISCAVVAVALVLAVVAMLLLMSRHSGFQKLMGKAQLIATCQEQLRMVGQALNRYEIRNGEYPDRLSDLYPTFIAQKSLLKCPADDRDVDKAIADSYTYVKPAPNAPGNTPVVICNRHPLMPNSPPMTVVLQKDGKVTASATK